MGIPEQQRCGAGTGNCFFGEILKLSNARARGTVQRGDFETFASGLRNSVGMTTSPDDQQIWFTDNGRDNWGDNRPADELNFANFNEPGQHFGYPYCYGYGD